MATLSEQEKEEIVRLLARFRTPTRWWSKCGSNGAWKSTVSRRDPTIRHARVYEAGERWRVSRIILGLELASNDPGISEETRREAERLLRNQRKLARFFENTSDEAP